MGKDDTENVEQRRWGEPRAFDFEPEAHWDIGKRLELFDPEVAAKITGKRFHVYKGLGAGWNAPSSTSSSTPIPKTAIPKFCRPLWSTGLP